MTEEIYSIYTVYGTSLVGMFLLYIILQGTIQRAIQKMFFGILLLQCGFLLFRKSHSSF